MTTICYDPIGVIHSPFQELVGMPIQPAYAGDTAGYIELLPEYVEGLDDLAGFSHIWLIYHFHRSVGFSLRVKPFLEDALHGVFATRAPRRPNAIGLSLVALERIDGNILHLRGVDMVDGTPLLDIKPYAPAFDERTSVRIGWLEGREAGGKNIRADARFIGDGASDGI